MAIGRRVARAGIEPATFRFSGERYYRLSYLAVPVAAYRSELRAAQIVRHIAALATPTGLEPATSAVTGRRANQLRHGAFDGPITPFGRPRNYSAGPVSVENLVYPTASKLGPASGTAARSGQQPCQVCLRVKLNEGIASLGE